MMDKTRQQKIALITGGGSGIGFAVAERFVQNGIFTIIVGRDKQKLESAREKLGKSSVSISFDLCNLHGIPNLVQEINTEYGGIDILVNNAGINLKKDFTSVSDEEFEAIIRTNVMSLFSLSREISKKMIANGWGSIINISSMAAKYGLPKVIAYSASKAAVEGMTRAMAVELSPKGVRVNCIAPGFIETDMSAKALNDDKERKQKVLSRTPMGALGKPLNVADAALFLASDASSYVTGVVLPVDGGNSIGF